KRIRSCFMRTYKYMRNSKNGDATSAVCEWAPDIERRSYGLPFPNQINIGRMNGNSISSDALTIYACFNRHFLAGPRGSRRNGQCFSSRALKRRLSVNSPRVRSSVSASREIRGGEGNILSWQGVLRGHPKGNCAVSECKKRRAQKKESEENPAHILVYYRTRQGSEGVRAWIRQYLLFSLAQSPRVVMGLR